MAEQQVEYNYLSGNCGLKVSNICLGTMVFGNQSDNYKLLVPYPETCNILNHFVALGGNFIDTSNKYCYGDSERFIGNWLSSQERDKIVLATKCRFQPGLHNGLSRKSILLCVEESLKRLKTDYIDLYQIHCWDSGVPLDETLSTLNDLVRSGKVRYLGGSNLTGWQLQKIIEHNRQHGYSQFVTLQQQYNMLERTSELEAFEVCKNEGLGILPWSPLKGGMLTGKFKRGNAPLADSRIANADFSGRVLESSPSFDQYKDDENFWKIDDLLQKLATNYGKTVAQVSLRWLLQKQNVTSVIIGAKTIEQLENNLGAGRGWKLSDEDMKTIDELSSSKPRYPYNMSIGLNDDRRRSGCPNGRQF